MLGPPDTVVDLGETEVTEDIFMEYLSSLGESTYRSLKIHLPYEFSFFLQNSCLGDVCKVMHDEGVLLFFYKNKLCACGHYRAYTVLIKNISLKVSFNQYSF